MVTVNLTLLVELVLFLIFLWGAHRIAFKPVVKKRGSDQKSLPGAPVAGVTKVEAEDDKLKGEDAA